MTLEESTARALAAVQTGDLDDLVRAVQAREEAIGVALRDAVSSAHLPGVDKGASIIVSNTLAEAIDAGEALRGALEVLKRGLNLESSRLRRIQDGFSRQQAKAAQIILRG
jgi:hypothetical protein